MPTFTIQRKFGNDLLDTLSHNAAASPLEALTELVANSYDADAGCVEVHASRERLVVKDNGHGMSPKEVETDFYRVGDSKKKKQRISPIGRQYLGSFGLATLAIRMLAKEYTLITTKDGETTRVQERFGEVLTLEDALQVDISKSQNNPSGTILDMNNLNIAVGQEFNVDKIRSHLAWTMPLTESNFSIIVNGEPVHPRLIDLAETFTFHYSGAHCGEVDGAIYLLSAPSSEAGVYIRVDGRRIGDPKKIFSLTELQHGLARRVIAQVSANGMQKHIRSDRGEFYAGKARDELSRALLTQMKDVRRFAEQRSKERISQTLERKKESVAEEIAARCRGIRSAFVPAGMQIQFSDELPKYIPGKVQGRTILLNNSYSLLCTCGMQNVVSLREAMLSAVISTIALNQAESTQTGLVGFLKNQALLGELLRSSKGQKGRDVTAEIFSTLHYTIPALANILRQPLNSIRYLIDRQVLPCHEEKVRGQDFIELRDRTRGLIPLPLFAKEYLQGIEYQEIQRFETVIYPMIQGSERPFILNIGKAKPCFMIESVCAKELALLLNRVDLRKVDCDIQAQMKEYREKYCSLSAFGVRWSMKNGELAAVLNYAEDSNIPIQTLERSEKEYHLGDFITAMQRMRGVISS